MIDLIDTYKAEILAMLLAMSHTLGFICFRLICLKKYPELIKWNAQIFMYFTWPFILIIAFINYKR